MDESTKEHLKKAVAQNRKLVGLPPQAVETKLLPRNLRNNIENILDRKAQYYHAEVGDRLSNVVDLTDAIMREVNPVLHAYKALCDELAEALREAKKTIKLLHGESVWDIYDQHSPEMKKINGSLAKYESMKGEEKL